MPVCTLFGCAWRAVSETHNVNWWQRGFYKSNDALYIYISFTPFVVDEWSGFLFAVWLTSILKSDYNACRPTTTPATLVHNQETKAESKIDIYYPWKVHDASILHQLLGSDWLCSFILCVDICICLNLFKLEFIFEDIFMHDVYWFLNSFHATYSSSSTATKKTITHFDYTLLTGLKLEHLSISDKPSASPRQCVPIMWIPCLHDVNAMRPTLTTPLMMPTDVAKPFRDWHSKKNTVFVVHHSTRIIQRRQPDGRPVGRLKLIRWFVKPLPQYIRRKGWNFAYIQTWGCFFMGMVDEHNTIFTHRYIEI